MFKVCVVDIVEAYHYLQGVACMVIVICVDHVALNNAVNSQCYEQTGKFSWMTSVPPHCVLWYHRGRSLSCRLVFSPLLIFIPYSCNSYPLIYTDIQVEVSSNMGAARTRCMRMVIQSK